MLTGMSEGAATTALAVYGSLAPGEPNHWVLSRIKGDWVRGQVQGYVFELTWGPAEGYLGFIADADGQPVGVDVLLSDELDKKWREIDDFEGEGYVRTIMPVTLASGETIDAHIYVALTDS
jgi:gamma-glutamylcyclotransferase (GGCT)/AIG2-like uncharacterized protein YtfP